MKTDGELQQDVIAALKWEPALASPAQIGVAADHGIIRLSGLVHNFGEKWAAGNAVKKVRGVRALANEIEVRLPGNPPCSDTELAEAARMALDWNVLVPSERLSITVEEGWITLSGKVDRWHQKQAAEAAVRHLFGARGVTNQIAIAPAVSAAAVQGDIASALERNARLNAANIQVSTEGTKAILSGTVQSCAERDEAEWAAWAAPGVTAVENELFVSD